MNRLWYIVLVKVQAGDSEPNKIPLIVYRTVGLPSHGKRIVGVRTDLGTDGTVALHGFIKKTRSTPVEDLAIARKRLEELTRKQAER